MKVNLNYVNENPFSATLDYLYDLLIALDGINQHPKYHPEIDALYHSLQVFQCALKDTDDPELLAAALFHDIGKATDSKRHAEIGKTYVDGILTPRIAWLIEHHLDLLISPKKTRQRYHQSTQLLDLQKLRKWDLSGRKIDVLVISADQAISMLAVNISDICIDNQVQNGY